MAETNTSIETDAMSVSGSMEPIQLSIDGRSMMSHEIEDAIELATGDSSSKKAAISDGCRSSGVNSLSLTSVGLNIGLTEDLVRLIRQKTDWESISLTNFLGDRTLCNDLLLACTTHPSIRSLAWRTRIADGIHASTNTDRILAPTDSSTLHALLYGLKYNSHLTRLEATGLVLDANMTNLLSRALVRNTTLLDLRLNGTRFLSENSNSSSNQNGNANENNNRGTKNIAVQTLSFGLRFNRTIESLSLEMCSDLEDADIACLINAVNADGTVLRRLSLQNTACFDQGMSSVAVLLQGNVIEELNLNYLLRRRRQTPEQEENNNDEEEEQQPADEDKTHPELVETTNSDEEEKDEDEEKPATEAVGIEKDQEDEQSQDETPSEDTKSDQVGNDNEKEQERQQVRNTSLKILSMAGNSLDDEYLESLLGIFPPVTNESVCSNETVCCSHLEELNLLGNRFSNHGIKGLLKKLPRFPYLQRFYLGYQKVPPPSGPTALPQALLVRMIASNPSLLDRNAQFSPSSLRKELVAAVSENPSNFRLTNVNIMALSNEDKNLDRILHYHMKLNAGGRKLLASYGTVGATPTSSVPLGLWPLVLDRANRVYPLPSIPSSYSDGQSPIALAVGETKDHDGFHVGDVIFCLLHGPMVFENLDRRPMQDQSTLIAITDGRFSSELNHRCR